MEKEDLKIAPTKELDEVLSRLDQLEKGLASANDEIAEAKKLPSVQAAKDALKSIVDIDNKVKPFLDDFQAREKKIFDIQASAEKKESDINALLVSVVEQEAKVKELLKAVAKNLDDKQVELERILKESSDKIENQHERIEMLIPGATSAKLASAFKERKDEVAECGIGWILLMVGASLGLVAAGIVSWAYPGEGFWSSLPSRSIVVVGLLLIEEFSRRNYNIKRRLSEAYGYKEVMARSFHGYKEAMAGVKLPPDDSGRTCNADEKLISVFLKTLSEEPGKNIFDKEKSVTFSEKVAEKLVEVKPDDNTLIAQLIKGNVLSKITWPLVALCSVVVVGVVILMCFGK